MEEQKNREAKASGIIGYDLALSPRSNCVHGKTHFDATTGKIEKGSGRWRYRVAQRGRPYHYSHLKCTHSVVDRTQIENPVGFLRERITAVTDATERAAIVEALDLLDLDHCLLKFPRAHSALHAIRFPMFSSRGHDPISHARRVRCVSTCWIHRQ